MRTRRTRCSTGAPRRSDQARAGARLAERCGPSLARAPWCRSRDLRARGQVLRGLSESAGCGHAAIWAGVHALPTA